MILFFGIKRPPKAPQERSKSNAERPQGVKETKDPKRQPKRPKTPKGPLKAPKMTSKRSQNAPPKPKKESDVTPKACKMRPLGPQLPKTLQSYTDKFQPGVVRFIIRSPIRSNVWCQG